MARRSPQTQAKRQREFAKLEKRQEKAEKKALRKAQKEAAASGEAAPAEEPGIAQPAESDPPASS